jgi:heat shock protein HtpX
MPAIGLYGHIRNNSLKSALLLAGFVVLIAVYWWAGCLVVTAIKFAFFDRIKAHSTWEALDEILALTGQTAVARWYVPLAIAGVWFTFCWLFYQRMIRAATGARAVERREEPKLYNLVETLAISAGLPMPRVEIIETDALNAYAAGLTPAGSTVAVTRGLLDTLDKDELTAVLAHEMTHIKNRDVRLMVVALIFAGGITFLGDWLRSWFGRSNGDGDQVVYVGGNWGGGSSGGGWGVSSSGGGDGDNKGVAGAAVFAALIAVVVGFVMMGMAHVFAMLTQFAISRSREFMADAGAVELTKDPDALISALRRISGNDDVPCSGEAMMAMMISRGGEADDALDRMFASHPPIEDRVSSLQTYAGGRSIARRLPASATQARTTPSVVPAPVGFRARVARRSAAAT